jgi:lysophospholipase L1-like esterase
MPLGDSITAGQEAYRGPLYRWLVGLGRGVDFVGGEHWEPIGGGDPDHEAHGGYTIGPDSNLDWRGGPGNLAQNVDTWVPAARPDIILLAIGSNDLAGGPIVAAAAPGKLRNLVAKLHLLAPNAWIIVSDMLPNRWSPSGSPDIDTFNNAVRDIGAASSTDRVVSVSALATVRSLGFDLGADLLDQVHLSVSGGEKWAQAWRPSVLSAVDVVASDPTRCTR